MNDQAKKKARQAELEFRLMTACNLHNIYSLEFSSWLEFHASSDGIFEDEAEELIALYEEE